MRIHIIGSGCPDPRAKRYGSAFILEVGKDFIQIDCGPATTYKMAIMGMLPVIVEYLFFTHHHSDHNADFPCFSLARWDLDNGSLRPLKVYGPPPTREFVELLIGDKGAFAPDINSRIIHPASHTCHIYRGGTLPRHKMNVEAHNIDSNQTIENKAWKVITKRVQHVEPSLISLAYRFETKEGSILFAGDCAGCDSLSELAEGVDTLVMCCTHFGESPRSITDVVAGTTDVANTAKKAKVKRVILTHANSMLGKPSGKEKAISEIAKQYDGEILFPEELTSIII